MKPPYKITGEILGLVAAISHSKEISPATASRDLKNAVGRGILEKSGDKRLTKYKFRK